MMSQLSQGITVALTNIGQLLSGSVDDPILAANSVLIVDGMIADIGTEYSAADLSIDCMGLTVAPGLVDTHSHPGIGTFTEKQSVVGYLDRYVHGGVTEVVSAGELHIPGHPRRSAVSMAVAVAAAHTFPNLRPSGLRISAGSLLLDNDTTTSDIQRAHELGIRRIGEVGIGSLKDMGRAAELCCAAREVGMTIICHSGGTSDRRDMSNRREEYISASDILQIRPTVAAHVNGGFVPLTSEDLDILVNSGVTPFMELVAVGSLAAALRVVSRLSSLGQLRRLLIGTDTPSGYGVMPLGILKVVADLASLSGISGAVLWAAATGNAADAFGLEGHRISVGAPADLIVFGPARGSVASSGVDALDRGEMPGIAIVLIDGEIKILGSQGTTRSIVTPVIDRSGTTMG